MEIEGCLSSRRRQGRRTVDVAKAPRDRKDPDLWQPFQIWGALLGVLGGPHLRSSLDEPRNMTTRPLQ